MAVTLQILGPYIIERGIDTVLDARSDSLIVSASAKIYDDTGALIGTYTDSNTRTPSVTVPAADTTGLDYSALWRVEWTCDGRVQRESAHLVRLAWVPSVIGLDLYDEVDALDPSGDAPVHDRTDFDKEIARSAREIQAALVASGNRPWQVFDPSSLRIPHLMLALAKVYDSFAGRGEDAAANRETADHYRGLFRDSWGSVSITIDLDQDGEADTTTSAQGVTWLMA